MLMATMTRQHYALIAQVLKERLDEAQKADQSYPSEVTAEGTTEGTISAFAIALADTNAQFDESKFLKACGRG